MKELTKETQADVLKRYLAVEMMSQKELALRIDMSTKHISQVCTGKKAISMKMSMKLRYVFDTEDFFFSRLPFKLN